MRPKIVSGWRDSAIAFAAQGTIFGITYRIGVTKDLASLRCLDETELAAALLRKAEDISREAMRHGTYDWHGRGFRPDPVRGALERNYGVDNVQDLISR